MGAITDPCTERQAITPPLSAHQVLPVCFPVPVSISLTARDLFPVHSYPLNKLLYIALNQEPDKIVIMSMEAGIAGESPKPSSEEETWVRTCESDFVGKSNYWEFQLHQDEKIGCYTNSLTP